MHERNRVAVIGLGKLGLPVAAVFAAAGYMVVGHDKAETATYRARQNKHPYPEPGLDVILSNAIGDGSFVVVDSLRDAINLRPGIIALVLPTPSRTWGEFNARFVHLALRDISTLAMQCSPSYTPLVCVISTVSPGTMSRLSKTWPTICYTPTMAALGNAIETLRNPPFQIVAAEKPEILERATAFWAKIVTDSPIFVCSFEEGEISKIAANTFICRKINFANMVREICTAFGANSIKVCEIIGTDPRIGHPCLSPGPPPGGPCFPRDQAAFRAAMPPSHVVPMALGYDPPTQTIWHWANKTASYLAEMFDSVLLVGWGYKEGTTVIEGSPSACLAGALSRSGVSVLIYDPFMEPGQTLLDGAATSAALRDGLDASDVVVLCHRQRSPELNEAVSASGKPVLDLWGPKLGISSPQKEGPCESQ